MDGDRTRKRPSLTACEELLAFAFEFYAFVEEVFFKTQAHPILDDRQIAGSLLNLLRKAGMSGLVSKFEDIQPPLLDTAADVEKTPVW